MSSGKRYSKEEKEEIMFYRQSHTYQETAEKYDVSQMSLARWSRKYKNTLAQGDSFRGNPLYKSSLSALKYLEGMKCLALFSDMTDGSSIASIFDNSISEDALTLAMLGLLSAVDRTTNDVNLGTLDMILTKNTHGYLLIRGINPELLIVMIYDEKTTVDKIVTQDIPFMNRVIEDIRNQFEKR